MPTFDELDLIIEREYVAERAVGYLFVSRLLDALSALRDTNPERLADTWDEGFNAGFDCAADAMRNQWIDLRDNPYRSASPESSEGSK